MLALIPVLSPHYFTTDVAHLFSVLVDPRQSGPTVATLSYRSRNSTWKVNILCYHYCTPHKQNKTRNISQLCSDCCLSVRRTPWSTPASSPAPTGSSAELPGLPCLSRLWCSSCSASPASSPSTRRSSSAPCRTTSRSRLRSWWNGPTDHHRCRQYNYCSQL